MYYQNESWQKQNNFFFVINLRRNDDRLCVGPTDGADVWEGHRAAGQVRFAKFSAKSKIAESETKLRNLNNLSSLLSTLK